MGLSASLSVLPTSFRAPLLTLAGLDVISRFSFLVACVCDCALHFYVKLGGGFQEELKSHPPGKSGEQAGQPKHIRTTTTTTTAAAATTTLPQQPQQRQQPQKLLQIKLQKLQRRRLRHATTLRAASIARQIDPRTNGNTLLPTRCGPGRFAKDRSGRQTAPKGGGRKSQGH